MLAVQIVGVVLMVLGVLLLVRAVGAESDLQVPGVTIKAPSSVLVLLVGVLVFLFPFSPWWPAGATDHGGQASPTPFQGTSAPSVTAPPLTAPPVTAAPVTAAPVTESPAAFAGTWKNIDPNARSIVQIDIAAVPAGWSVRPWGACTPTPCDWGIQTVAVPSEALTFDVNWDVSFAVRSQHYQLATDGTLAVRTMTHFIDNSGRADYTIEETFAKSP